MRNEFEVSIPQYVASALLRTFDRLCMCTSQQSANEYLDDEPMKPNENHVNLIHNHQLISPQWISEFSKPKFSIFLGTAISFLTIKTGNFQFSFEVKIEIVVHI